MIEVSSAKRKVSDEKHALGRSLKYMRKRNGPSIEPCGTPQLIFLTELHWGLRIRSDWKDSFRTISHTFRIIRMIPVSSVGYFGWMYRMPPADLGKVCKTLIPFSSNAIFLSVRRSHQRYCDFSGNQTACNRKTFQFDKIISSDVNYLFKNFADG